MRITFEVLKGIVAVQITIWANNATVCSNLEVRCASLLKCSRESWLPRSPSSKQRHCMLRFLTNCATLFSISRQSWMPRSSSGKQHHCMLRFLTNGLVPLPRQLQTRLPSGVLFRTVTALPRTRILAETHVVVQKIFRRNQWGVHRPSGRSSQWLRAYRTGPLQRGRLIW